METKTVCRGIFLTAFATLLWQILITRIFSASMYYHFVFMSISLAMLGFACSGMCVYLFPNFFNRGRSYTQLAVSAALFSATMIAAVFIYVNVRFVPERSAESFYNLLIIFVAVFVPYFFSGMTTTLTFKHHAKNITRVYFYDLIGAGLGCLAVVGLLFLYDGISLVFFTAFIASLAAIVFTTRSPSRAAKQIAGAMAAVALASFIGNAHVYRFLKIKYINGKPETGIIFEKWNPINRVTVIPDSLLGHDALNIRYDATANAHMHAFDGAVEKMDYLKKGFPSFYFQLRKAEKVLVIGTGGGQDVLNAYVNGSRNITAVEINPTIARLNREVYRDFNGNLFGQKGIRLIVDDGRHFVRTTPELFDIILLSNADSGVASSSGAFTFVENSLYTAEAFRDYLNHLQDDGILWINRWRFNGDLETLKILSSCLKALEFLGIGNPQRHIVIIAEKQLHGWTQALFLCKKSPFTDTELRDIDSLRAQRDLIWLHDPRERLNTVFAEFIHAPSKESFIAAFPLRIQADTDNCPFFFNFLKLKHYIGKLPEAETQFSYPVFMFKSLFLIIVVMVIVTIFLPMLLVRGKAAATRENARFRWGYILYFACLGFGYMLIEIPLIQKFILFLGQPLYAIAVILSSLLIFSGIGSLLAGNFTDTSMQKRLGFVLIILCALLTCSIYSLPYMFDRFLGMPGIVKIILTLCAIAPLGICMGMALPVGIRLVEKDGPTIIPWVWAVNGACSVLGSVVAWGVSLNFGFNATLWAAAAVYLGACLIMCARRHEPAQQSGS